MASVDLGMRRYLAALIGVAACSPAAPPGGTATSVAPVAAATAMATTAAAASGPSAGLPWRWQPLLQKGSVWALKDSIGGHTLRVEVVDVHPVPGASVARLKWTLDGEDAAGYGRPARIAVSARGVHFIDTDGSDADVAEALKSPPLIPEPPVPIAPMTRPDGHYLTLNESEGESVVCVGSGPPPHPPPCDDVCDADICFGSKSGIRRLTGNWAPHQMIYEAGPAR